MVEFPCGLCFCPLSDHNNIICSSEGFVSELAGQRFAYEDIPLSTGIPTWDYGILLSDQNEHLLPGRSVQCNVFVLELQQL